MESQISPTDLFVLLHEADAAARRLLRKLHLPRHELDDLRQEILVDLIARLPAFDPERGTLGAFAGVVARNRAVRLARRVQRQRRLQGGTLLSLDAPVGDDAGATLADRVAEDGGLAALFGQEADALATAERRIDLERALARIARRDGALCVALAQASVDELAQHGRGARATLYRRVKALRLELTAHGLRGA